MNIPTDIYCCVIEFLNNNEIKNLNKINKILLNDKKYIKYCNKFIINRSVNIIIRFWRKYINICKIFNYEIKTCRRTLAFYYFKNYERSYIKSWYNVNIGWKREIIDKYKKKEIIRRIDLYNLILRMPVEDTLSIGW